MAPIIYNLFPRLAGTVDKWFDHAMRAHDLGFDWLYLNPVTLPGFSGSLYAVKEHRQVCPDFLSRRSSKDGISQLKRFLAEVRKLGLRPAMDLVINHTAFDCPLVEEHPDWFVRDESGGIVHPSAIDPADARKVTVWGDLAELNNAHSPDLDGLWDFWRELVRFWVELGFCGFRCDAAYKVPALLWRMLVDEAREVEPEAVFFAETLGCRIEEVRALQGAGLDYLFNSSRYWMFDAPWAIEQHELFGTLAPSVSFPESHDTPRLAAECGGNEAVLRQRYLFAAMFSEGLLMPIGYEFGFQQRLNVVKTRPEDWEQTGIDLSDFIRGANELKRRLPLLAQEGHWRALTPYDRPTIVLEKTGEQHLRLLLLVNKDWNSAQGIELAGLPVPPGSRLGRLDERGRFRDQAVPSRLDLGPAEIVLIY